METLAGMAMSADALRGYIKALRSERGVTQPELAQRIGMPLTTYKDWERGITKDIKTPYLIRAVQFLRGSFDHIAGMGDTATSADGVNLARELVVTTLAPHPAETLEKRDRVDLLIHLLAEGIPPAEAAQRVLHER